MLVIVPMFHANAWGVPYAAWMIGADLVFPQQFLQAAPLSRVIAETKPTLTGAVPTVLNDLLHNAPDTDMSSVPAGDVRRLGRAARSDRRLPRHLPRADRAGLGHDRDQPRVRDRPSAEGHGRAPRPTGG
jgi:fatty-acyl-CoA synthase